MEMGRKHIRERSIAIVLGIITLLFALSLILALALLAILNSAPNLATGDIALIIAILDPTVAAVGLCLVVIQLHKDGEGDEHGRLIEQHRFLLEYNKVFIENERMLNVEASLEAYDRNEIRDVDLITDENRQSFVNYLVYLEGFAPLVLDEVVDLQLIDNLMAYRFYLAVNNPVLQREELLKFPGYYLGIFRLYRKWTEYRKPRGLEILRESTSALDSWDHYDEWLQKAERAIEKTDE